MDNHRTNLKIVISYLYYLSKDSSLITRDEQPITYFLFPEDL